MIMDSEGLFLWHFVENKKLHGIKSSNAISYFTTWFSKKKKRNYAGILVQEC